MCLLQVLQTQRVQRIVHTLLHLLLLLYFSEFFLLLLLIHPHLQLDVHAVFVVGPLLVFFFLQRTISGNVSYLITIETLKVGVVPLWETFSCSLEPSGKLRILLVSLLEVGLTYSSLGMSG